MLRSQIRRIHFRIEQDYIYKVPVIFHDNVLRMSHKPYGPPSVTWFQALRKQTNTGKCIILTAERQSYAHTTSHTLPTSNINLGSLTLPAPEAGDFVELLLLYSVRVRNRVTTPTEHTSTHYQNKVRDGHWNCWGCHTGAWRRVGKCSLVLNFGTRWANQMQTLCTGFHPRG